MRKNIFQLMLIFVAGVIVSSASAQNWIKINDNDAGISYSSNWKYISASGAYMNDAHWCEVMYVGETAEYTFTGTQVRIYVYRFDDTQSFDVYIDTQFQQNVSVGSGPNDSYMAWESGTLANTSHTIQIVTVSGETHLDAFEYDEGADTDPPSPDPATWASAPAAQGDSSISMTATTGSDPSGVQYRFDETSGNPGGSDSGWQTSPSYTDSGLNASTQYCYRVRMRDQSPNQNTGSWSTTNCATTTSPDTYPPTPDPATWASVPTAGSDSSISMTATTASDPSGVEYYFMETSANPGGSDSGWQDSASYIDTGLNPSTQYCYEVQARDKSSNKNLTAWSTNECATTLAEAPNTFYVAPGGNDSGAGTIGDPWATLAGARDNIRPLLDGTDDITVYFRGGTYTFTDTVVFGLSDDGTATQSITYAAYPGETPIFSSLVQVTGWSTYSGNIMQADLPGGISSVRYLQDSSENWLPRSATAYFNPDQTTSEGNEGPMYEPDGQAPKQTTQYPTSWTPPDWSSASQYDLRISTTAWSVNVIPISSVNSSTRYIDVATPATYPMKTCYGDCAPCEAWVLNSIDGIDSAGEWACLNGKIYLYPASGTSDITYRPSPSLFALTPVETEILIQAHRCDILILAESPLPVATSICATMTTIIPSTLM